MDFKSLMACSTKPFKFFSPVHHQTISCEGGLQCRQESIRTNTMHRYCRLVYHCAGRVLFHHQESASHKTRISVLIAVPRIHSRKLSKRKWGVGNTAAVQFLVFNHVTRRLMQYNFFSQNLEKSKVKFPMERQTIILDHQHGRHDITCKPATEKLAKSDKQKWRCIVPALNTGVHKKGS